MKAIGYFRDAGGVSLAEQNKAFMDYCSRHGLKAAETFAEQDNGHGPAFRQVVERIRQDAAESNVVVVSDVRTLGRDLRHAAMRLYQLEWLGAQIALASDGGDAEAALMAAWQDGEGGGRLSHRVRDAMRKKAVKGEVLGRPPYGYKVGARRRLELVPEEAVVVRYIFRLYLQEHLGIRLIARRLNEEGIRTRRGGNWSMVSIRDILRNRAYLGTYARFDVRVTHTHPALVKPDEYQAVQDRLNSRRSGRGRRTNAPFLLSGLAYCGHCGNKLIGVSRTQSWKRGSGERVTNSYRYYQCESRTNQSMCAYHTRRAAELEDAVRTAVEALLAAGLSAGGAEEAAAAAARRQADADRLRSRVRALDRRLEGYIDAAARGRISRERMHGLSLRTAAERLAAEDLLDSVERQLAAAGSGDRAGRERATRLLLEEWDAAGFEQRQASLRDCVLRIDVTDDRVAVTLQP